MNLSFTELVRADRAQVRNLLGFEVTMWTILRIELRPLLRLLLVGKLFLGRVVAVRVPLPQCELVLLIALPQR